MISPIRWLAHFLQIAGALALGYAAFLVAQARTFQSYQGWAFDRALEAGSRPQAGASGSPAAGLRTDSLVGRIEIPSLHLSTMVLEGDGEEQLRLGAGHIPGTALPGEAGNVVIAAHRDTFFRPLRRIAKEDQIVLTTLAGSFQYRVDSVQITEPDNTAVLRPSGGPELTLVTCYPFSFIGPAPQRFVVHATRVGVK
jgi:sortase A